MFLVVIEGKCCQMVIDGGGGGGEGNKGSKVVK